MMYFYQELFQGFAWSLQLVFEDIFDSVAVFLALPVFRYSSRLTCLYVSGMIFYFFQLFGISFDTFINLC